MMDGPMKDDSMHSSSSASMSKKNGKSHKKNEQVAPKPMATIAETMSFVFDSGGDKNDNGRHRHRIMLIFAIGTIAAILNGLVYPILAYLFSNSFSDISGAASEGLSQVRELAFAFLAVGVYALICATIQTYCFEMAAHHGAHNFRVQWFQALLRQDAAFFDVHDVGGIAAQIGPNANKYRRGVGRKLGEAIQFFTTGLGGLIFAFYSSWQVALVVLLILPLCALAAMAAMTFNQTKGQRAAESYKRAGSVAYAAVSAIKTVLSLNAIPPMVQQYTAATTEAFNLAKSYFVKVGFANGSMLASFLLLYAVLTLFGSFLLYSDVLDTGCDPSGAVAANDTCTNDGPGVFGAMLGVAFAGQGVSQFGNCATALAAARTAVYEALLAIRRKPGTDSVVIYKDDKSGNSNDKKKKKKKSDDDSVKDLRAATSHSTMSSKHDKNTTRHSKDSGDDDIEDGALTTDVDSEHHDDSGNISHNDHGHKIKAILPKYEIDSFSTAGLKPNNVQGHISIKNVHFSYPTRPHDKVLNGLSAEIQPGAVIAFVGPSGGGKSTVVSMLERFYDPLKGCIELDGIDIKDINVSHLRSIIGYVGQEPTLFATTIRGNIQYGNPNATQEQIECAARMANAHDFISSFSDGYDTQVGDKGSQLSGGQKQRIAIARVLVANPKILLLDEATSALDAESELVVQEALDNILGQEKITTIIIAHRLSTIRNADKIHVIARGKVVEEGTHNELMSGDSYYRKLVLKQEGHDSAGSDPPSRNASAANLAEMENEQGMELATGGRYNSPHLSFNHVTFAYPTRPKKKVLDKFSLTIEKGTSVALVGPSGGGKSTTVGLMERFYDTDEGEVLYMGVNVKELNVHWYRDQIGYVGQEPTLFQASIAENVAFGCPGATQEQIEEACIQANAHDFIMQTADGYQTNVGDRGAQLSGGQKQRIAIARALVKKPKLLILDEATSALDNESESIVQAAIDKIMRSPEHTCLLIAHRLSTIREADKIALIAHGHVLEFGSHDELINKPHGRYKRLFESSKRSSTLDSVGLSQSQKTTEGKATQKEEEEEDINWEALYIEEAKKSVDAKRARAMARPDVIFLLVGVVGAVFSGGVFPMWGVLFSETMDILFRPISNCPLDVPLEDGTTIPDGFESCDVYWQQAADDMRSQSYFVSLLWVVVIVVCLVGNVLTFWGFGMASERLNKRVRDASFTALLRQEVAFFDKRSVGSITSQLQDDAQKIHSFSGEPIRAFFVAISSILVGITLSFFFMWEFALLAIACVPLMGFATSLDMKQMLGSDEGVQSADELNSPGGIIVETLLNMRTVSALTLERERFANYEEALRLSEPDHGKEAFWTGVSSGLSMFIQQWINALQMWFGGYLLFTNPLTYTFRDFLISNFAILFGLFGLGSAFQDITDKKAVEESVGRIFHLLERKSAIDPLSEEGKKLGFF